MTTDMEPSRPETNGCPTGIPPHAILARAFIAAVGGENSPPHNVIRSLLRDKLWGPWTIKPLMYVEADIEYVIRRTSDPRCEPIRIAMAQTPNGLGAVIMCAVHQSMKHALENRTKKRRSSPAPTPPAPPAAAPPLCRPPPAEPPPAPPSRPSTLPTRILDMIAASMGKPVRMTPVGLATAKDEASALIDAFGASPENVDALARALLFHASAGKATPPRDSAIIKMARSFAQGA